MAGIESAPVKPGTVETPGRLGQIRGPIRDAGR
jgi:hypothetical protein